MGLQIGNSFVQLHPFRRIHMRAFFQSSALLLFVACLPSALAADYAERVAEDKPVAWWQFEGDAKDSSNNGHDGKLVNGVTFVDGLPSSSGKAAHFNGIDSLVEIRNRTGLRQETLSIELWFRSTQPFDEKFWPGSATLISTATSGPGSQDWLINAASQDNKNEGVLLAHSPGIDVYYWPGGCPAAIARRGPSSAMRTRS